MSVQRYRFGGDLTAAKINNIIPPGMTATINGVGPGVFIDINLSNDAAKPDLDGFLASLGWTFIATAPTTPLPISTPVTVMAGRSGNTTLDSFYRGVSGLTLDATTRGLPVPAGTLSFLAWTKSNGGSATLQVLNNGVAIATLTNPGAGVVSSTPNVAVTAGLLSFRNIAPGGSTQNVQITAEIS